MAGEAVPFLLLIFKTIFQGLIGRENAKVDDDCGHYFPLTGDDDQLYREDSTFTLLTKSQENCDIIRRNTSSN